MAAASASTSFPSRVPQTQSQCAATVAPCAGRGASVAPSADRHRTVSVDRLAEAELTGVEHERARSDDDVLVVHGIDGAPTDPAGLQDPQRGGRVGVEEPHPRVDDEHVKAVVGQHRAVGRHVGEQPARLARHRACATGPAAPRRPPGPAAARPPSRSAPRRHRAGPRSRRPRRSPPDRARRRRIPARVRRRRCHGRPAAPTNRAGRSNPVRWVDRRRRRTPPSR